MKLIEMIKAKGRILESDQSKLPSGVLCRGVWPICNVGVLNQNNRMYERDVFEKVIADDSIKEKMENRTLFGQAEHPEKTQSDLQLTSHIITNTFFDSVNEADKQIEKVFQEIDVLDTPCGRIINTLIEAGCQVGVSTRAEGDLEEKEGEDGEKYQNVVPEAYGYVTTDYTADPSTFNVAPVSIESTLVKDVVKAVHEKEVKDRVSKEFAVKILEGCKSEGGVKALNALLEEKACKSESLCVCVSCGKCNEKKAKNIEDLINQEMVKMGVGIVIREGKFDKLDIEQEVKGKITEIKEGMISIELEDGTSISAETSQVSMDNVEITFPEAASDMGLEDEELDMEEPEDEELDRELPGEPSEESPREELPPGFESKQRPLPENYEKMVAWMQNKFRGTSIKDLKIFGNLVRTKLLNEKITATSTSKEIRVLKIKEASIRAERDAAMEMVDEIETKLNSIIERSPLEFRMVMRKLEEAKYTDAEVQALCKKLEEKQKALNEVKSKFNSYKDLVIETTKKTEENEKLLNEANEKKIVLTEEKVKKIYEKKLVKEYTDLKLSHSGLRIHKNARALLEKCISVEDVDEVFEDIKEAMKMSALRPDRIDEITIQKEREDPKTVKIKETVKNAMDGMK